MHKKGQGGKKKYYKDKLLMQCITVKVTYRACITGVTSLNL